MTRSAPAAKIGAVPSETSADELDAFVFDQVRDALLRPEVLLAGEHAVTTRAPTPDDELLGAQLSRLDRKADAAKAERDRLVDLYQGGLIDLVDLQRRAKELDIRRSTIDSQRQSLADQRSALAKDNRLRQRIGAFAERAAAALDKLDFDQRQKLIRLVIDEVRVAGWNVEIRLRIPLDDQPDDTDTTDAETPGRRSRPRSPRGSNDPEEAVSSNDRLRSLGEDEVGVVEEPVDGGVGDRLGHQCARCCRRATAPRPDVITTTSRLRRPVAFNVQSGRAPLVGMRSPRAG